MPFTQIAAYSENYITHKYTLWTKFKATKRLSRRYRHLETSQCYSPVRVQPTSHAKPTCNVPTAEIISRKLETEIHNRALNTAVLFTAET